MANENRITTPKFRAAFANVFKPKAFEGQDPKYSITMLFPKNTDMKVFKDIIEKVATEKWGPKAKWPKGLRNPIRNGDEKSDLQGYEGNFYISASSKDRVGLVDQKREDIISPSEFYSGCYARATLTAFAYDKAGNKGVSFGLQNIQKLADGESFSGRKAAKDDFDDAEDSSEEASSYEETDDLLG
jgi:hypothetical protein